MIHLPGWKWHIPIHFVKNNKSTILFWKLKTHFLSLYWGFSDWTFSKSRYFSNEASWRCHLLVWFCVFLINRHLNMPIRSITKLWISSYVKYPCIVISYYRVYLSMYEWHQFICVMHRSMNCNALTMYVSPCLIFFRSCHMNALNLIYYLLYTCVHIFGI